MFEGTDVTRCGCNCPDLWLRFGAVMVQGAPLVWGLLWLGVAEAAAPSFQGRSETRGSPLLPTSSVSFHMLCSRLWKVDGIGRQVSSGVPAAAQRRPRYSEVRRIETLL